jgi:hypothetical protein
MKDPKDLFKDPVNPTKEELKTWAYGGYYQPEQDFSLFVVDDPSFVLGLASDPNCPTRDFFLESLYVWVGDQVKKDLNNKELLLKWIKIADKSNDARIKKLVSHTRDLINKPETYDYSK